MQKIVPNLWFQGNAAEGSQFYEHALPDTHVVSTAHYPQDDLPDFQEEFAGELLTVELEISGYRLMLINAGREFLPNPAISFMLNFDPSRDPDARDHLETTWSRLSMGGTVLMPLGEYPFMEYYGWVQDRFGVSWQLMLTDPNGEPRPFVVPSLMFGGAAQNRAGEAIEFYTSVFDDAARGNEAPYPEPKGPAKKGALMFADFTLEGEWLAAMDSGVEQDFTFTPGVSLSVSCAGQAEIDKLWEALSAVPEAEACGWCTDRFGVSWQVVPDNTAELLAAPGAHQRLLTMKKIDIAGLRDTTATESA